MPRALLVALCTGLGVALVALAFLLGRMTAGSSPGPAEPPPRMPSEEPRTPDDVGSGAAVPAPSPIAESPLAAPSPIESPAIAADVRAAVALYFAQLEQIEAVGRSWNDPQQFALQLVQQGAQGDRSGFRALLATEQRARESLRAMHVPPACREHHSEAVALMDEAVSLLGHLNEAVGSQDLGALTEFATTAQALQARTERLDALGRRLKRQYGVAEPAQSPGRE